MKRLLVAHLTFAVVLVSGCVPIRVAWVDWPDIDGKVIDVVTGKPVVGAAVGVHAAGADFSASTTTGTDGAFHLSRHTRDQWVQYDFKNNFPSAAIAVTATGYDRFDGKLDGSMSIEAIPLAPVH